VGRATSSSFATSEQSEVSALLMKRHGMRRAHRLRPRWTPASNGCTIHGRSPRGDSNAHRSPFVARPPCRANTRRKRAADRHASRQSAVATGGHDRAQGGHPPRRHPRRQLRLAARRRPQAPRGDQLSRGGERVHRGKIRVTRAAARQALRRVPRPHQADRPAGAGAVRPIPLLLEDGLPARTKRFCSIGTSAPEPASITRPAQPR
jgi:hypothetical protein